MPFIINNKHRILSNKIIVVPAVQKIMSSNSPEKRYLAKLNQNMLDRVTLKSSLSSLSNVVCIENLVKKNSMFVPSKMNDIRQDRAGKFSFDNSSMKYRKQIEPHKAKTKNSFLEKTRSNIVENLNKLPSTPNKKPLQSVSPVKKQPIKQYSSNLGSLIPPTASFYLKKGQKPIYFELKVDIKKVQSLVRDPECKEADNNTNQRTSPKKVRSRNYPRFTRSQLQKAESTLSQYPGAKESNANLDSDYVRESDLLIFAPKDKKRGCHNISQKQLKSLIGLDNTHIRYNQERSIKSTLTSYMRVKNKKIKENSANQNPTWKHIKEIIKCPQKCDENLLQLVEEVCLGQSQNDKKQLWQNLTSDCSANCIQVGIFDKSINHYDSILSKEEKREVEIASLTKIMTCMMILNISKIFNLDLTKETQRVSERASKMPGTSAYLSYSDVLTIQQLLYGLMLPSGNDAAVALGEWGGKIIRKYCNLGQKFLKNKEKPNQSKSLNLLSDLAVQKKSFQKLFIFHMNKAATTLNLKNTFFANTHGLMNEKAHSTASDICKLTCIAMKNPIFCQIVSKKQFQCKIYNRTYGQERKSIWKNTNKLLKYSGFVGVKTGVTPAAGPCLSSIFQISSSEFIVIIVLRVKSMQYRFKQSLSILQKVLQRVNSEKYDQLMLQLNLEGKKEVSKKLTGEEINIEPEQEQNGGAQPIESEEDEDLDE